MNGLLPAEAPCSMRISKPAALSGTSLICLALAAVLIMPASQADARKKSNTGPPSPVNSGTDSAKMGSDAAPEDGKDGTNSGTNGPGTSGDSGANKAAETELDPSVPHVKPSEELDDFGRRAQQALKEENAVQKPHPLQERYPDYDVVVCEAGCGAGGKIVYKEKKGTRKTADVSELVTTAGSASAASTEEQGPMTLVCTAGCYDSKKVTRSVEMRGGSAQAQAPATRASATADAMSGKWMPGEGQAKRAGSESGSWMAKINGDHAAAAPSTAAAPTSTSAPATTVAKAELVAPAASPAPAAPVTKPVAAAALDARAPAKAENPAAPNAPAAPAKPVEATAAAAARAVTTPVSPTSQVANAASTVRTKEIAPPSAKVSEEPAKTAIAQKEAAPAKSEKASSDKTVMVGSDDPDMKAAIEKARSGIGEFWRKLEKPGEGEGDFALKVAITDKGQTEHFWVTNVERKGGKIAGVISNSPTLVKNVSQGQHYEFTEDRISDWLFKRNGKMVGNETMRPLLKHMPKEQAEAYQSLYEKP